MSDEFSQIVPNGMKYYKNNPNLKGEGVSFVFTKEQIEERIKCTKDPIYFIEKYMKIVHVDRGLIPFELYGFQKKLLKSYIKNRFTIAKLPRQVGKSTVTISYILWTVLFGPMQNIAILANKAATARDILAKLQLAYEFIPLWMQQGITEWNKGSIQLENGSKVIAAATASSAARGSSYNCVAGDSRVTIRVDNDEKEVTIQELYDLISKSSQYDQRNVGKKEIQYVHREQVQKTIHENCTKRLFTPPGRQDGIAPHNPKEYGRNQCSRKYCASSNSASHNMSQTFTKVCDTRISKEYDHCVCNDDSHSTLHKSVYKRISDFKRFFASIIFGSRNFAGNTQQNFFGQQRKVKKYPKNAGTLQKHINWPNGGQKDTRACGENQSQSRKNSQNGRSTSRYETQFRISNENESSSQRACSLESRETWCLLQTNFRKDAKSKGENSFNRGAQKEFKNIEILTEEGYKKFHGIKKTKNQKTIKVVLKRGEITCTPDHQLFTTNGYVEAKNCLGQKVLHKDGSFHDVEKVVPHDSMDVYDLLEVSNTHSYYCNGYLTHQCIFLDEFAFVPKNIAEEFITSVYPTISSGKTTKVIMVSTPNGMNLFYKYWTDAVNKRNLYVPIEAHYSDVPGRNAAWAEDQKKQLGEQKFNQEFGCVSGDTVVGTESGDSTMESIFNAADRIYLVYKITRDDGAMRIGCTTKNNLADCVAKHKESSWGKGRKVLWEILEESTSKKYVDMKKNYYVDLFTADTPKLKGLTRKRNKEQLAVKKCPKSFTKSLCPPKLSATQYNQIRNDFLANKKKYPKKISKNGRPISSERQYAHEVHESYGVSCNAIVNILTGRVLR